MGQLKDLHTLGIELQAEFEKVFSPADVALPASFMNAVKGLGEYEFDYKHYSIHFRSENLNGYIPNQWFIIASFFVDFYKEVLNYKVLLIQKLKDIGTTKPDDRDAFLSIYNTELKRIQKADKKKKLADAKSEATEAARPIVRKELDKMELCDEDKDFLEKFVCDYDWWYGGKTIDRGDFYVSPILNLAKVVNASHAFIADICKSYAESGVDYKSLRDSYSNKRRLDMDNNKNYQIIYYGAPGTGKSHQLKEDINDVAYTRTIFHPDSDYSSFVGCYKPVDNGERITYFYQPQAFVKAYVKAWLSNEPYYLVIEEINRGNCAQIFGDIFQLLDRSSGESEYEIEPDTDLQHYLKTEFSDPKHAAAIANKINPIPQDILDGKIMKLPANLLIRATMNTSDQSLFPMDSAFKRRWSWRFFSIKDEGKGYVIKLSDGTSYDWWKTIEAINTKILNTTKSADKQLGYWFAKVPEGETIISADDFVSKVIFYLWNDVFKDYSFGENNAFSSELSFERFYSSDGKVIEQTIKDFMDRNYPKEDATA